MSISKVQKSFQRFFKDFVIYWRKTWRWSLHRGQSLCVEQWSEKPPGHNSVGQTIIWFLILSVPWFRTWNLNHSISSLSPVVPVWTPSLRRRFLWTLTGRTAPVPSSACLHPPAARLKGTIRPTTPRPALSVCPPSRWPHPAKTCGATPPAGGRQRVRGQGSWFVWCPGWSWRVYLNNSNLWWRKTSFSSQ